MQDSDVRAEAFIRVWRVCSLAVCSVWLKVRTWLEPSRHDIYDLV